MGINFADGGSLIIKREEEECHGNWVDDNYIGNCVDDNYLVNYFLNKTSS